MVVTTSADKTSLLHKANDEGSYNPLAVLKDHTAEVVAAGIQITQDYLITASQDKSWCFYDIQSATCLQQVTIYSPHQRTYLMSMQCIDLYTTTPLGGFPRETGTL